MRTALQKQPSFTASRFPAKELEIKKSFKNYIKRVYNIEVMVYNNIKRWSTSNKIKGEIQMKTVKSLRDLNKMVNQSVEGVVTFQVSGDDLDLFVTINGLQVTIQDSLFKVEENFQDVRALRDFITEMFSWELE